MPALQVTDLKKTYKGGLTALNGINLTVQQGDFFALLGPNGAGKSTTIGIISSLVERTSGNISVFGYDTSTDLEIAKSHMGITPQEMNFNQFETVLDIVVSQAGYYGVSRKIALVRAQKYLEQLDLWDKRKAVSRTLSGGMKRRLMIARALVHEPKMLILDEPTAGVDIELRRSTWKFLQNLNDDGCTIILTTHYLEEAEHLCRGIAIIDKGAILTQTTIKDLMYELQEESFVMDLAAPCSVECIEKVNELAKQQAMNDADIVKLARIDATTLEVTVTKGRSLNTIFSLLSANDSNIQVTSMRNKANRLEELFIQLVNQK